MKSPKELAVEQKIRERVQVHPVCATLAETLFQDAELNELQEYCNNVSIRRLGYNDHGPVHMRQVASNAVKILLLLHGSGIKTSLENEEYGTFEDSLCAVLLAGMCHDLGMAVGRQGHENMSALLAHDLMKRILSGQFSGDMRRQAVIRSLALEAVAGHMATRKIHSMEAGAVLIGDGCDMTRGRAGIPMRMETAPQAGDIHKYSAASVLRVHITHGDVKPVKIDIEMNGEAGFFQVEEVLLTKINASPAARHVELYAGMKGEVRKCYLA